MANKIEQAINQNVITSKSNLPISITTIKQIKRYH